MLRGGAEGEYSAFCYAGDQLLNVRSINKPADHAFARRLLAAGRPSPRPKPPTPAFDLRAARQRRCWVTGAGTRVCALTSRLPRS